MPILSIIIPVYNKRQYLSRCLDSILQQSWRAFEIILVDDGSTDGSVEYEHQYAQIDSRIKVYEYENAGVSMARNRGVDKAVGDYLMFIDADDYIAENYLNNIMENVSNMNSDLYIWGITKKYQNKPDEVLLPKMSGLKEKQFFLRNYIQEQYKTNKGLYGFVSNKLIKKSIIQKHSVCFDTQLKLGEDYDFWIKYFDVVKNVFLFCETGYYYVNDLPGSSAYQMTEQDYYTTLMVHGRCWILLEKNNALIEFNRMILTYKINEAILATFLELNNPSYKKISQLDNSINMLPGIGCVSRERTRLLPYLLYHNYYFLASLFLRVRKLYHII